MKSPRLLGAMGLLVASIVGVVAYHRLREKPANPYVKLATYYSAHVYGSPGASEAFAEVDHELAQHPDEQELLARKIHLAIEKEPMVAVTECRRILQKDPRNVFALTHCSVAYMVDGDLDKAMYYAALAYQEQQTADIHNLIGQIFYRRHDFADALEHYRKALELDPSNAAVKEAILVVERCTEQH